MDQSSDKPGASGPAPGNRQAGGSDDTRATDLERSIAAFERARKRARVEPTSEAPPPPVAPVPAPAPTTAPGRRRPVIGVALAGLALLLGYLWLSPPTTDLSPAQVATDVTIPDDLQSETTSEPVPSSTPLPAPSPPPPPPPTETTTVDVETVERPDSRTTSPSPAAPTSAPGSIPRAAPREGSVSIQVAAYDQEAQATALASRLAGDGLPAYILEARLPTRTVFRVRLGAYPNREAAEAAGEQLRVTHELDWFLVSTR